MSPIRYLIKGYSKLTVFSGTSCRSEFWWLFSANTGFLILSVQLSILVPTLATPALFYVSLTAFLLANMSAATRRLNDAGWSPFWMLIPPAALFMLIQPEQEPQQMVLTAKDAEDTATHLSKLAA